MMWIIDGEERVSKNMVSVDQCFLLVYSLSYLCMSVLLSESVDGTTGNKKLAMTVSSSISSSQTVKKIKTAKRKQNSISGSSSAKVIF